MWIVDYAFNHSRIFTLDYVKREKKSEQFVIALCEQMLMQGRKEFLCTICIEALFSFPRC